MRPSAADVGRRVVVRHRLDDGRAGDVVGELRSWDDGCVRVAVDRGRQAGTVVEVSTSAVVAARVVGGPGVAGAARPPTGAPAVRPGGGVQPLDDDLLGTSVGVAARRTALGWAAPHEAPLGDWLLRGSAGRMMRASSALATGDPGRPVGEALGAVAHHYRGRSQVPAVQVSAPLPGGSAPGGRGVEERRPEVQGAEELEGALARDGWQPQPWTVLALRPAAAAPPSSRHPAVRVEVSPSAGPAWLAASDHHGSPLAAADLPPERDGVAVACAGSSASDGPVDAGGPGSTLVTGPLVAVARGALAQRWLGITCVAVDPGSRRRGLAGAMTEALLDHLGGPPGVDALYVQVVGSNTVARAAWRALGFTDHSRYRFWTLPGA